MSKLGKKNTKALMIKIREKTEKNIENKSISL
jgi:hypothetical protein